MRLLTSILLLTLGLLAGCRSTKKVQQSSTTTQHTADSTTLVVVERLRIDTVPIPGAEVVTTIELPCPPASTATQQLRAGHVTLTTSVGKDGKLELRCKADSLLAEVYARDREITNLRSRQQASSSVEVREVEIVRNRVPVWVIFALLAMAALVGFLFFLLTKKGT